MLRSPKRVLISIAFMLLLSISVLAQATEKGLFWKMESPSGQVSYLFGTIHTDDNRVTDFPPCILDALKSVDLFVMETLPSGNPTNFSMQKDTLKTMLTEVELDKVKVLSEFHVMRLESVLKMKPWLLAVVFSQSKPQTPYAQDNLLMRGAEDFNKSVEGLETNEEHFGVVDSFSLVEQMVILRSVLKLTEKQKERDFERLMAVYLSGDSDKIVALDAKITSATLPKPLWQKMRVKLLDERNVLMAQRAIDKAKNKSVFVAVGASHLAGDAGFINQFKKAGYKLTLVKNRCVI